MKIGNIDINQSIVLAPMEDVTDTAFRLLCRRMGADIVYTEFTSSEAIIRDIPRALNKIKVIDEERPVAIQIFGAVESSMEEATKKTEEFKPDFIDINCGCWVKNHANRGEGAGLLKDLPKFERIVKSVVKSTKLPVTVKTRLGWDSDSIVIMDVAKMVEAAGAKALALHCRVRAQAHEGPADWTWLEKVRKAISIPLIGNGDVRTPQDVKRLFDLGCDGAMIGRAAIGNPWIFREAQHYIKTGELLAPPTLEEKINVCIEHLKLSAQYSQNRNHCIAFRKYYAGYLRGIPHIATLRSDLMQLTEIDQVVQRLNQFLEEHSKVAVA